MRRRVIVDWDRCTGNGICESLAEDVFEIQDNGDLKLLTETVPDGQDEAVEQAVAACPTDALSLTNTTDTTDTGAGAEDGPAPGPAG